MPTPEQRQLPDDRIPYFGNTPPLHGGTHRQISFLGPQGIDYSLIPGYSEQAPIDFESWFSRLFGGGGGGGGGGRNAPQAPNASQQFLEGLYGNIGNIGQLDSNLLGNIYGLQGEALGNYDQFNQDLSSLGAQYNQQIGGTGQDLLNILLGEMGTGFGGRGGGGGFSFGGAGSISSQGIEGILASLPEFQAREIRTALPELDPRLAEELNTIKEAQLADFEAFRGDQNSELLTQLFGRGVQRSTVAGEAAGRASEGLERTRLQIMSEDVARRLGIRTEEANRILQGDLGSLSAEAGTFGDRLRATTGIRQAELGAEASAAASSASAGASAAASRAGLEGDRLRALASIYGSQTQGLSSLFGNQVGGMTQGFGTQQGTISNFADLFGGVLQGNQQAEIGKYLGLGEIAGGVLNTEAQERASRHATSVNARLGSQQNQLGFLNWMNDVMGRFQEGTMGQAGFDLQRELAQLQADTSRYQARQAPGQDGGSSDWMNLIGTLAMSYATYASDARLKTDIHEYNGVGLTPEQINKLHPILFRYIHDSEILHSGVLAQELEKISPDLVLENEITGYKMVKYDILATMLLKGYRDYIQNNGGIS